MTNVVIDRVDPTDTKLMSHMFNLVFRPERPPESFDRRLKGRHNPLFMVARIDNDAVGFYVGLELKPTVHFAWLCGVSPDVRRMGVATQLMHAAMDWARTEAYNSIRFECDNHQRAMLHFGISAGYDIVGLRWDADRSQNLIIFERLLMDAVDRSKE
ncbi:MAG: GNAT family N-acetyltransferase [Phycisphaeraceae bacterium]|nr:MAG: GNAT family N-acetyltransferase [Phycisphaeraceae bacterium]